MKTHKILCLMLLTAVLGVTNRTSAEEVKRKPLDLTTYHDKSLEAYVHANRENKYLLLLFNSGTKSCIQMRDNFRDDSLAHFSDQWIVSYTNPNADRQAKKFATQFNIEAYPMAVLIKTTVDSETSRVTKTDVVGRMRAGRPAGKIDVYFRRAVGVYESQGKVLDVTSYHDHVFEALEKVKKEDKYLMVVFNSNYCGFCDRTLNNMIDPKLAKYSEKLIVADIDPDFDTDAQYFADRFVVKRYPTILLMRPVMKPFSTELKKMDLICRMSGEQTAEEIDDYFQKSLDKYERELASEASQK